MWLNIKFSKKTMEFQSLEVTNMRMNVALSNVSYLALFWVRIQLAAFVI